MIYGLTKGTDFEKLCDGAAKAEAAGVMTYYALARMAKEQGKPITVFCTMMPRMWLTPITPPLAMLASKEKWWLTKMIS